MPMVWHDAVSQESHVKFFHGFFENFFKEFVIFVAFKYLYPSICSIDYMVDIIADVSSFYSCHAHSISLMAQMVADPITPDMVDIIADVSSFYSCHAHSISLMAQMVADPITSDKTIGPC